MLRWLYLLRYPRSTFENTFPANGSPNITVDKVFNVTVKEENLLTVVTSDADGDKVTVTLNSTLPEGASFDNEHYRWKPVNMDPVDISYVICSQSDLYLRAEGEMESGRETRGRDIREREREKMVDGR